MDRIVDRNVSINFIDRIFTAQIREKISHIPYCCKNMIFDRENSKENYGIVSSNLKGTYFSKSSNTIYKTPEN